MQFSFQGYVGRFYGASASTNLVNLTNLPAQFNTNVTISIVDNEAANYPRRFYRAYVIP